MEIVYADKRMKYEGTLIKNALLDPSLFLDCPILKYCNTKSWPSVVFVIDFFESVFEFR